MCAAKNESTNGHRVVVGVDGSEESKSALRWAVGEAERRGALLEVISGWSFDQPDAIGEFEQRAESVLQEAVTEAHEQSPKVTVKGFVEPEGAAEALVRHGEHADLLVVGTRRRSSVTGLLLGSVSQECAHHGGCPLVIVPHEEANGN